MGTDKTKETQGLVAKILPRFRSSDGYTWGLVGIGAVVAAIFTVANPTVYTSGLNIESIALSVPEIAILALAIAVAMTAAGIDLSIVPVANLASLLVAWISGYAMEQGMNDFLATVLAVAAALAVGAACGLLNGFVIAKFKVTPILTTLATMQVYAGIAIVATRGEAIYGTTNILTGLGVGKFLGIPAVFWLFILVAAAVWGIMNRTKYGIRVTMMGSNDTASLFSGFRITDLTIRTYMFTGILAAIAGIIMVSRTGAASASYGGSYLMVAITIAVLGGANPFGGKRAVIGVGVAAVVLQMIASGLNMIGVSPYIYQIVQGAILVGASVVAFERRLHAQRAVRRLARKEASERREVITSA